jgi:hypothetical protein
MKHVSDEAVFDQIVSTRANMNSPSFEKPFLRVAESLIKSLKQDSEFLNREDFGRPESIVNFVASLSFVESQKPQKQASQDVVLSFFRKNASPEFALKLLNSKILEKLDGDHIFSIFRIVNAKKDIDDVLSSQHYLSAIDKKSSLLGFEQSLLELDEKLLKRLLIESAKLSLGGTIKSILTCEKCVTKKMNGMDIINVFVLTASSADSNLAQIFLQSHLVFRRMDESITPAQIALIEHDSFLSRFQPYIGIFLKSALEFDAKNLLNLIFPSSKIRRVMTPSDIIQIVFTIYFQKNFELKQLSDFMISTITQALTTGEYQFNAAELQKALYSIIQSKRPEVLSLLLDQQVFADVSIDVVFKMGLEITENPGLQKFKSIFFQHPNVKTRLIEGLVQHSEIFMDYLEREVFINEISSLLPIFFDQVAKNQDWSFLQYLIYQKKIVDYLSDSFVFQFVSSHQDEFLSRSWKNSYMAKKFIKTRKRFFEQVNADEFQLQGLGPDGLYQGLGYAVMKNNLAVIASLLKSNELMFKLPDKLLWGIIVASKTPEMVHLFIQNQVYFSRLDGYALHHFDQSFWHQEKFKVFFQTYQTVFREAAEFDSKIGIQRILEANNRNRM